MPISNARIERLFIQLRGREDSNSTSTRFPNKSCTQASRARDSVPGESPFAHMRALCSSLRRPPGQAGTARAGTPRAERRSVAFRAHMRAVLLTSAPTKGCAQHSLARAEPASSRARSGDQRGAIARVISSRVPSPLLTRTTRPLVSPRSSSVRPHSLWSRLFWLCEQVLAGPCCPPAEEIARSTGCAGRCPTSSTPIEILKAATGVHSPVSLMAKSASLRQEQASTRDASI